MLQNLILRTILCGTGFITQHGWVVDFRQIILIGRKYFVPVRYQLQCALWKGTSTEQAHIYGHIKQITFMTHTHFLSHMCHEHIYGPAPSMCPFRGHMGKKPPNIHIKTFQKNQLWKCTSMEQAYKYLTWFIGSGGSFSLSLSFSLALSVSLSLSFSLSFALNEEYCDPHWADFNQITVSFQSFAMCVYIHMCA